MEKLPDLCNVKNVTECKIDDFYESMGNSEKNPLIGFKINYISNATEMEGFQQYNRTTKSDPESNPSIFKRIYSATSDFVFHYVDRFNNFRKNIFSSKTNETTTQ